MSDSNNSLPQSTGAEALLLQRVLTLLTRSQSETALGWNGLAAEWQLLFEQHRRQAIAAQDGLVDGGDMA